MAVITISRQVASLGDEIAAELAGRLGYHLVTREETHRLAVEVEPEFASRVEHLDEAGLRFWERLFFRQPKYQSLFAAVVLELASRRQTIIMGRGAQVVLRRVPQVLRVRVVAPRRVRAARLRRELGVEEEEAREYLAQHDQARRALVSQIFTHDLRNWGLYHLVLNTEALEAADGADILEPAVRVVERTQPLAETSRLLARMALGKRVETRLRQEVLNSTQLRAQGEEEGAVRLVGSVPSAADSRRCQELAENTPGVGRVDNELKTSRVSFRWPA
jgi:cytidylate kinase